MKACRMACTDEFIERKHDKYLEKVEQGGSTYRQTRYAILVSLLHFAPLFYQICMEELIWEITFQLLQTS